MKTLNRNPKAKLAATSLVLVLVVSAAGIVLVSGIMSWISTNTDLTLRINRFRTTTAAGGAATEKVIGHILTDFQIGGIATVSNNLASYTAIVPSDQDLLGGVTDILDPILDPILGILEPSPQPEPEPSPDSTSEWANYEFSDGRGNRKKSQVTPLAPWTYSQLTSQFSGLNAYSATFRLVSNVRETEHKHKTLAGVQQELVLASIPVFGFHVFYAPELEICPSSAMTLGRVHANKNIYCEPGSTLTFAGPVTTSQRIIHDNHPSDPSSRTLGQIISQSDREGGVNTLLLALGTNRTLADFRKIIEVPPSTESRTSALGRQRLYNMADLIIKITSTGFSAHSGAYNSFATTIPWSLIGESITVTPGKKNIASLRLSNGLLAVSALKDLSRIGRLDRDEDEDDDKEKPDEDKDADEDTDNGRGNDDKDDEKDKGQGKGKGKGDSDDDDDDDDRKKPQPGVTNVVQSVVNTNVTFYNARENKTVRAVEIDIYHLLLKSNDLATALGRPVKTLYVVDTRSQFANSQSGVRIVNGHKLPATGLTIVTPNPLYVLGSYNSPTNAQPVPAALIGDAITILSAAWQDGYSTSNLTRRVAVNSTVNAALLCGIVPSGGGYYSGGLENLPRLLEDWNGKTLTLKGSLVALYHSTIATAPWGARADIYKPPQRDWSYDTRLNTLAGLPPSTPELRTAFRRSWQSIVATR